jgi:hypothetical protein
MPLPASRNAARRERIGGTAGGTSIDGCRPVGLTPPVMLALKVLDQVRVYSPSAANLLLSKALPWIIPSSAGYGMRVEELTAERAVSSLPLRRKTRNHVGSMYFGVQMTLPR